MSATADSLKAKPASDSAPEEPPKKSKKKLIIIFAVVLLLVGGYEAKSILMKPHYKAGQKVPLGKIVPLDQILTNLSDGNDVQVNISLQLTTVAVPATISQDLPRFDDAAIAVLGADTEQQLLTSAGRTAAKAKILADVQKIAGTVDGAAQQVTDIYFTNFIMSPGG